MLKLPELFNPENFTSEEEFPRAGLNTREGRSVFVMLRERASAAQDKARLEGRQLALYLLDVLPLGVIVLKGDGAIDLINRCAARIFNVSQSEVAGKKLPEVVVASELDMIIEIARGGSPISREIRLFLPEEKVLALEATTVPGPDGKPHLIVCAIQDISHIKRLEKVRKDFVANVSHELRTPLANIAALIGALQSAGIDDPRAAQEFAQKIEKQVEHMAGMIDDFLTLSRVESDEYVLKLEDVPLSEMVSDLVGQHLLLAKNRDVQVDFKVDSPDLMVRADRHLLGRALKNLLDNAIRYNRPGGSVWVRAFEEGGEVRLEFRDTGVGIPKRYLERVFERFFRLDSSRSRDSGGTGLGLSIVKHVAEVHGGRVEVESREGVGSTFTIVMPRSR